MELARGLRGGLARQPPNLRAKRDFYSIFPKVRKILLHEADAQCPLRAARAGESVASAERRRAFQRKGGRPLRASAELDARSVVTVRLFGTPCAGLLR